MKKTHPQIDPVRASRDGHEFHEAWAARKALQLVMPTDGLVGIAVEGLAPADQPGASRETVEIADLTLYYGKCPTFAGSRSVVIVQFKYSKSSQSVPYRASDATKTIRKFAAALRSYRKQYAAKDVERKIAFELVTNRPIYRDFASAIGGLASGIPLKGDAKKQATQFASACGFKGNELVKFAKIFKITGLAGSLRQNQQNLSRILADWSVAPDALARARLGNLRQLVREKAGLAGEKQNCISRTDVLDALELQSSEDLFPCPASFPEIGKVVEREQLLTLARRIPNLDKPLLIHADGGVGKTVFLQSLAKALGETHEIVLFDCFGGGAYRAPEDARHLPKRGLVHIINNLARDGLCDPLLPINENVDGLLKSFRIRLAQAVATLRRGSRDKQLLLFIDAIDNAAELAKEKGELAFPRLLLESFHHNGPIAGVQLILSCRTYRRDISRGDIPCEEFELQPFCLAETERYLRQRIRKVTATQIQVAYTRSEGNPRILEHLALSDRGLLDQSEVNNAIKLDDLLRERIRKALEEARKRDYRESDINAFLAGLSTLPPPVPLDEYADAHGMDLSAVKSFAADLSPLLEQTRHGLMFRDEPTETLVRKDYASQINPLQALAENLFRKQGASVYAASALPGLLLKLDDGERLFKLAFDTRFPAAISSTVGRQNIRYARLKAAVLHAARTADFDRLTHLLVELSTLAAVNQRGTDFILDNPDLLVASHDVDAIRRLFETRPRWPGTRHARLTIAGVLSGDLSDASRHAVQADEWIHHYYRQGDEYHRDRGGPQRLDIASIALWLVAQNRGSDAAKFMTGWKEWYAYEISEHIFSLLQQAQGTEAISTEMLRHFLDSLKSQAGVLAAALAFLELTNATRRDLVGRLARACDKKPTIEVSRDLLQERDYLVQDGLLNAMAIAVSMKMHAEALTIAITIPQERPRLWSFTDRFSNKDVFRYIAYTSLRFAVERKSITEHTLLPQELVDIGARVPNGSHGEAFRMALKAELEEHFKSKQGLPNDKKPMSYETKVDAERFVDERLEHLLQISEVFAAALSSGARKGDKSFLELVDLWTRLRMQRDRHLDGNETNVFFDLLGRQFLIFLLRARSDFRASSVDAFVTRLCEDGAAPASTLIKIVAVLSKRPEFHELAGKTAIRTKVLIEREDEVSQRASLFAQLSRAIMPASLEETASYFRAGLEQMDAIGSGDYQFTDQLLGFAAALRGDELEEGDFHTLSNICELNLYDAGKFPWQDFARGLVRTSGCRSLAKLGRWADRDKSSLDYTLLPYLMALIEQDKIDPAIALGLLRISDPVELYACGTKQLAEVIAEKKNPNRKELLTELILQCEQNKLGTFVSTTLANVCTIAEQELGKESDLAAYLLLAGPKSEKLREEENEIRNHHSVKDARLTEMPSDQEESRRALKKIEDETNPADEASISQAVDALNGIQHIFDLKGGFFERLRGKVKYEDRHKYVQIVAQLETLDIYTKLRELKECKSRWSDSSTTMTELFRNLGVPLTQCHAHDFVSFDIGYLSSSCLEQIAELSGLPKPILALELIRIFAAPDSHLPASIWMGLAAIITVNAKPGEGQIALKRLLNGSSAKLASTVVDGAWKDGLYPTSGEVDIAAGMVWLTLGSASAACRWRAAHSVRCFARLGKWEVIDALMMRFGSTDAHPYQAPELPFYFFHARLWLLIAVARTAIDFPREISKHAEVLRAIALEESAPHVLIRHFAAQALLACANSRNIVLSRKDLAALKTINKSPFPRKNANGHPRDSFYQGRPPSMPEPNPEFLLDYDFDKLDVTSVSDTFDRSRWETTDLMTAWVRNYDSQITSMYDSGGRSVRSRDSIGGMTARHHLYGQQLGWHALFVVAGQYLARHPVVKSPFGEDDSWRDWLRRTLLTRNDGLWLADGVDRPPLGAQVNLREKGEKEPVITGDRVKLLSLLNIGSTLVDEVVVAGDWNSADGIGIRISSALVPSRHTEKLALQLAQEDPFRAWLPRSEQHNDGDEYSHSKKEHCLPWVVWPFVEVGIDETDPFGVISTVRRPHFTKAVNAIGALKPRDSFRRTWCDPAGRVAARSETWGRNADNDQETSIVAERLVCGSGFLKDVLRKSHTELLVLIVLRRYDKGSGVRNSQYWHTTAIVRINQSLDFEYYAGATNKPHETKY